jgi:tripartite ATP-independent transporter DctM subunit
MEKFMIALVMFVIALLFLLVGVPVAFSFGGVAMIFAFFIPDLGFEVFNILPFRVYGIMTNTTLMAVPLFIMMGLILEKSGMAEKLLISMSAMFKGVRGGLGVSVVLVGAILAASTGIVSASVVMMSVIALPLMINAGYNKSLASGTIAASGTLGQIIPPSIILIILGDVMSVSVGDLFVGAVLPGLTLVSLYITYILIRAYINKEDAPALVLENSVTLFDLIKAIVPPLLLMVSVLGSIFAGIASPTESAAFGVVGGLILATLQGSLNLKTFLASLIGATKTSCMIAFILAGGAFLTLSMGFTGLPRSIAEWIGSLGLSNLQLLMCLMVFYIVLGCFLDGISSIVLTMAVIEPMIRDAGINVIWFGIYLTVLVEMAQITPPVGFNLFVLQGMTKHEMLFLAKSALPMFLMMVVMVFILIAFPELATYLPSTIRGP